MICSLESRLTTQVPLSAPRLAPVRTLVNSQLAHRTTELFRALYPGLRLEENPDPQAPAGQVGADGVTRYNPATFNPTTLFHEHGHIWFAPVEAAYPQQARGLLSQMQGTQALARAEKLYPELDATGQQKEAFMELIGQTGSRALAGYEQRAQTALGRFYNLFDKWLYALSGRRFEGDLIGGKVTLKQVLRHVSNELLYGDATGTGRASQYTASQLQRLITAAVDQRIGLPNNAADLLDIISGKHTNAALRPEKIKQDVDDKLKKYKGKDTFFVNSPQSGQQEYTFSDTDPEVRRREIREKVVLHAAEKEAQLTEQAVDFYALSEKDRYARMHNKDAGAPANAERMLTQQLHELFPAFLDGDTVVAYGASTSPQYYNAAVDNGSMLLHVSARPGADGKLVVALASLTDQGLKESPKGETIMSALFLQDKSGNDQKSTRNKLRALRQVFATNVKLTSTALNLHGLQLQLTAMYLAKTYGLRVGSMAVGKIDTRYVRPGQNIQVSTNQTLHIMPLPMLLALKVIRSQSVVRALLGSAPVGSEAHTLLQTLDDDALYRAEDYQGSALDALEQRYSKLAKVRPGNATRLMREVRRYRQGVSGATGRVDRQVSTRALQDMLFSYLRDLNEAFGPHNSDLNNDAEFLLLTEAYQELAGINKHTNLPGLAGSVESIWTSFSAINNPFIQQFIQAWDADRNQVTDRYLAYKEVDKQLTQDLIDEMETTGLRTVGNRIVHRESSYYKHLLQRGSFDQRNPVTGQLEKKEISLYAFIAPGSAEFNKLGKASQAYIVHKLAQIENHVKARYERDLRASGKSVTAKELNAWHEENWGNGRIPLVRASVRSQVFRGEIKDAGKEWLERLVDDNPLHDSKSESGYYTLNDNYYQQGGEGQHGALFRAKLLGLELVEDYLNDQNKPEEHYRLSADGLDLNNQLEDDLRMAFDIFEMNQLKQELLEGIEIHHKMAKVAMRHQEDQLGTYVRPSANTADGSVSDNSSPEEKQLDAIMRKLVFNKREEAVGVGEKRIRNVGAVAGSITNTLAMGFSPMVAAKNQMQFMARALAIAGANGKNDVMFGLADVAWAAKEFFKPAVRAKLYALGVKYRMLRTDEHDLIQESNLSGRKRQILGDLGYWSMWTSKIQDDASALFTLLAQMHHENTWDSEDYDPKSGQLTYNEKTDRKNRGEAVVDAVHASLIQDGTLPPGGKLDRTYDGFLRRNLNSIREEMMGGYDSMTQNSLDTKWHGGMFKQMRGWMAARLTGAFGDERLHPNRGRYDPITGEKVSDYQAGVFTSLLKYMNNAATFGDLRFDELKNLTATDKKNLRLIMYNTALAASLYLIGRTLGGGWDDDDEKKQSNQHIALLDAAISEVFFLYQFSSVYSMLNSPIVSVTYIGKIGQFFGDVAKLDGEGAWQDVKGKVGVAKSFNAVYNALADEEPVKDK